MTDPGLHWLDVGIIIGFVLYQSWLGLRRPGGQCDGGGAVGYLLAGRRLTLPAFVATLVSTWYGGILGVGEYSYQYGVSNWLVFGVPYYLYALIFAVFLAQRARRSLFVSIADHLERSYGPAAGALGATIVFVMTVPAAYVLMLGVLARWLFGWPLWTGIVLGAVLSVVYVHLNGFRAVIRTDKIQFLLMFGGFAILLPLCVAQFGGWDYLKQTLPSGHLTWHGGNTGAYIASWYFIAAATLVEPAFYQRCYAARDEATARRGIFISVAFWIVFDFMTTSTGLYARAALPALGDAQASFPALAVAVLPPGLVGLFFAGLLATIVSTVDSYSLLAAISLGRDVLWRRFGAKPQSAAADSQDHGVVRYTRIALLASAVLAVGLALLRESVVELWRLLGSIGVPALVLPVLATFFGRRKLSSRAGALWIAAGGVTGMAGIVVQDGWGGKWWVVEPIYLGLAVSLIVGAALYITADRQSA